MVKVADGKYGNGRAGSRNKGRVDVADTRAPSTNGDNGHGRDRRGRFVAGNPGGPGNPHARTVAACRRAFLEAVTPADIRKVARTLVRMAIAGDLGAIKELLDRTVGKPPRYSEELAPPPLKLDLSVWPRSTDELAREIARRRRLALPPAGAVEPTPESNPARVPGVPDGKAPDTRKAQGCMPTAGDGP